MLRLSLVLPRGPRLRQPFAPRQVDHVQLRRRPLPLPELPLQEYAEHSVRARRVPVQLVPRHCPLHVALGVGPAGLLKGGEPAVAHALDPRNPLVIWLLHGHGAGLRGLFREQVVNRVVVNLYVAGGNGHLFAQSARLPEELLESAWGHPSGLVVPVGSLHRVSFPRPRLPVGQDRPVEAGEGGLHHRPHSPVEHGFLGGPVEAPVKSKRGPLRPPAHPHAAHPDRAPPGKVHPPLRGVALPATRPRPHHHAHRLGARPRTCFSLKLLRRCIYYRRRGGGGGRRGAAGRPGAVRRRPGRS